MITENLSTLKIHKLTKAQYDRELANGTLEDNAMYLTPDEEIDLSNYATMEQLATKVDTSSLSNYYTKAEIDNMEFITVEDIDNICGGNVDGDGIQNVSVDSALSETSENPVQNKVITAEFNRIYESIGNILNGAS